MATSRSRRNVEGSWAIVTTTDPAVAAYLKSLPPLDRAVPRGEERALVDGPATDGGTAWIVSKAAYEGVEALL